MTHEEASILIAKARAKANKFGAPVVVHVYHRSVQLMRYYSAARQAAILAGADGEIVINPDA